MIDPLVSRVSKSLLNMNQRGRIGLQSVFWHDSVYFLKYFKNIKNGRFPIQRDRGGIFESYHTLSDTAETTLWLFNIAMVI